MLGSPEHLVCEHYNQLLEGMVYIAEDIAMMMMTNHTGCRYEIFTCNTSQLLGNYNTRARLEPSDTELRV